MSESTKPNSEGNGIHRESTRVEGQATLSAIGDVSIAASEAVTQGAAPGKNRWLRIVAFLLFVYAAGSWAAIDALKSPPWAQAFVAPLGVVLIATLTFWRRQVWKYRARDWKFKEKARQDALNSLAHVTANGLNAIRANLLGIFEPGSSPSTAEHRKQVEQALERMEAALTKAIADARSGSASRPKDHAETSNSKAA